jgi:hypothetical protein
MGARCARAGSSYCNLEHLVVGNEQELRLGVNKAPDKPRTSDAIYARALTGNPLHGSQRSEAADYPALRMKMTELRAIILAA